MLNLRHKLFLYTNKMTIGTLGMFESQQVIEGEIFIHYRRQEMLSIFNRHELPAVYFECFIETQNFYGHFVDVHAVSSDWVRAIYIQKKGQNKIIALFNHTQNVVHLHPNHMIFSRWSIIHKGIPNMIYVFGLSVVLLLLFFSIVAVSNHQFEFLNVLTDALQFAGFGLMLFLFGFILPVVTPFYLFKRAQTLTLLRQLELNQQQILWMEQLNPQHRIYPLNQMLAPSK